MIDAFVFAAPFTGSLPFMFVAVEKFGRHRRAGLGWTRKEAALDLFDIMFEADLASAEYAE